MPGGIGLATHQLRDNGFLKVGRQQILWVRVFCGDGDGQRGKVFQVTFAIGENFAALFRVFDSQRVGKRLEIRLRDIDRPPAKWGHRSERIRVCQRYTSSAAPETASMAILGAALAGFGVLTAAQNHLKTTEPLLRTAPEAPFLAQIIRETTSGGII